MHFVLREVCVAFFFSLSLSLLFRQFLSAQIGNDTSRYLKRDAHRKSTEYKSVLDVDGLHFQTVQAEANVISLTCKVLISQLNEIYLHLVVLVFVDPLERKRNKKTQQQMSK